MQGSLRISYGRGANDIVLCEEGGRSRELLDELVACQRLSLDASRFSDDLYNHMRRARFKTYLLQCLVVDEASSILGDLELAFLDLLAKLPGVGRLISMRSLGRLEGYAAVRDGHSTWGDTKERT